MRKTFLRFAAIASVIIGLLTMVGCTTMPESNGVLTLKQTQLNVSWKMTAYRQATTGGNVTEAQAQRVEAADKAYKKAFQKALADAGGNLDAPTPPELRPIADQVIAAVDDVLSTL